MNFFKESFGFSQRNEWKDRLSEEKEFWESLAANTNTNRPEFSVNFYRRAGTDEVLKPELDELFPPDLAELDVLDVGSGPITQLGSLHPNRTITITPVDPLADYYNELLDKYKVKMVRPRTIHAEAEDLGSLFEDSLFDLVYSRNALDHSYDPVKAIAEMVRVCKPGGVIWIETSINEGEKHRYQGLHQWNFEANGEDDIRIWNKNAETSLKAEYGNKLQIESWVNSADWVTAKIQVKK